MRFVTVSIHRRSKDNTLSSGREVLFLYADNSRVAPPATFDSGTDVASKGWKTLIRAYRREQDTVFGIDHSPALSERSAPHWWHSDGAIPNDALTEFFYYLQIHPEPPDTTAIVGTVYDNGK